MSTDEPERTSTPAHTTGPNAGKSLKHMTAGEAARLFPFTGKVIAKAINRRYQPLTGYGIDGRRLFQTLLALGDTSSLIFLDWLDREDYRILGTSGSHAHFPELARRCAISSRQPELAKAVGAGA